MRPIPDLIVDRLNKSWEIISIFKGSRCVGEVLWCVDLRVRCGRCVPLWHTGSPTDVVIVDGVPEIPKDHPSMHAAKVEATRLRKW